MFGKLGTSRLFDRYGLKQYAVEVITSTVVKVYTLRKKGSLAVPQVEPLKVL